jgi:hypothetical protein
VRDVRGLCMSYKDVKDDVGSCCHLFVQLVIGRGFSVDVEVFYCVEEPSFACCV